MKYVINILGQVYGGCEYGSSSYQNSTCQTGAASGSAAGGGSNSAAGGILTNTGFDLLLAGTLAVTIIFVALLVRFWKRPKRESSSDSRDS